MKLTPHTTWLKRKLKALRRDPLVFIARSLRNFGYQVRCFFSPFNIIKIKALPRTWVDRDEAMFHVMFQILVDFVELEQPFAEWEFDKKRHTDRAEMRKFIEEYYNPEGRTLCPNETWGMTDEEKASVVEREKRYYITQLEILYLYEWYKDKKYEFDFRKHYDATGERLEFGDSGILHVKTGKPSLITWTELHEAEMDHRTICNVMLERILKVREYLWT